jgi:hypothetical protein
VRIDKSPQARYFKSAFVFMIVAGVLILAVGAGLLLVGKAEYLFGDAFVNL